MEFLKDKNRIILSVISVIGAAIMGYLLYLHYSAGGSSFCDISEGFSCDFVNKSDYAKIVGIPISLLGLIYFLSALFVSLFENSKKILKLFSLVTIVLLGPSFYLTGIEYLVLKSFCILCEFSKLLMLLAAFWFWRASFGDDSVRTKPEELVFAIIVAVGLGLVTFFVQSSL